MNVSFNNISFEYPWVFVFILAFVIASIFLKAKRSSIYFSGFKFLEKASASNSFIKSTLKWLTLILIITALASPIIENKIVQNENEGYSIVLAMDASGSMKYPIDPKKIDFFGNVAPNVKNRFDISKEIVSEFIQKREHDNIGVVVFGDFAYVATPLSFDKKSVANIVNRLNLGIAGEKTAIHESLFFGARLFKGDESKSKILILLTDGEETVNSVPLDVAIKTLQKYDIKVYTIGIGEVDRYVLSKIAKDTKGKFFSAKSKNELKDIYMAINKLEKSKIKSNSFVKKDYLFSYPLFGAVASLSLLVLL